MGSVAQALQALEKAKITLVSGTRRICKHRPAELIEIMKFLYRRHPEIGVPSELSIKPSRSGFLGADTNEIGLRITPRRVVVSYVRFEWPGPTHHSLFSFLRAKSKDRNRLCHLSTKKRGPVFACLQHSQSA